MCLYIYIYVCVCMCIYTYMYVWVYVCVCVKGRRLGHAYSYRAMWMGHFWCWDIKNVPTKINP